VRALRVGNSPAVHQAAVVAPEARKPVCSDRGKTWRILSTCTDWQLPELTRTGLLCARPQAHACGAYCSTAALADVAVGIGIASVAIHSVGGPWPRDENESACLTMTCTIART
jgi:hypothetical protein